MDRQTLIPASMSWQPRPGDREVCFPAPTMGKHERPSAREDER